MTPKSKYLKIDHLKAMITIEMSSMYIVTCAMNLNSKVMKIDHSNFQKKKRKKKKPYVPNLACEIRPLTYIDKF